MGAYADKLTAGRRQSAAQIREEKNHRAHARNLERQAVKRQQAEERQAVRDARSVAEQLAIIDQRYGNSKKERARLCK